MEIRLHGALWRGVESARREEWQRFLEELNADNGIATLDGTRDDDALELVRLPSGSYQWRLYRDIWERVGDLTMDPDSLEPLFADYSTTIRQMVRMHDDAPARGFESLDYAKRVVHDEAAAYLHGQLSTLVALETVDARRLFTLLFLVGGDLPAEMVRFHRVHGG